MRVSVRVCRSRDSVLVSRSRDAKAVCASVVVVMKGCVRANRSRDAELYTRDS